MRPLIGCTITGFEVAELQADEIRTFVGSKERPSTFREVFSSEGSLSLSEIRVFVLADFRMPVDVAGARMTVAA